MSDKEQMKKERMRKIRTGRDGRNTNDRQQGSKCSTINQLDNYFKNY